jgi:hypothetical protein
MITLTLDDDPIKEERKPRKKPRSQYRRVPDPTAFKWFYKSPELTE